MQRVNDVYANRISSAFNTAITALKSVEEGEDALSLEIAKQLELLKSQVSDILSYTFEEQEELLAETRRNVCEIETKNAELTKLKKRLADGRDDRKERHLELSQQLSELKAELQDKVEALKKHQEEVVSRDLEQGSLEMKLFDQEMNALEKERNELCKQLEEQSQAHHEAESKLRHEISTLDVELSKVKSNSQVLRSIKDTEILDITATLEEQKKRRAMLEDHFERVDLNNAARKREEEALLRVAEISRQADALLFQGATELQRLFRGMRDRALVTKMKKAKKKGKGKKGSGKKK